MTLVESHTSEDIYQHNDEISMVSDPASELWQQGAGIEAQVFIDAGYVSSKEELAQEYEKYLPATHFILAKRDGLVGGSVRVVDYQEGVGFKTIDDINNGKLVVTAEGKEVLNNLPLDKTFEVGTLSVKKELRGLAGEEDRLAIALYGALYGVVERKDTEYILASFDQKFYKRFKAIFDPGVEALGPGNDYMGSVTIPALINVQKFMEHTRDVWGGIYDMMMESAAKVQYE